MFVQLLWVLPLCRSPIGLAINLIINQQPIYLYNIISTNCLLKNFYIGKNRRQRSIAVVTNILLCRRIFITYLSLSHSGPSASLVFLQSCLNAELVFSFFYYIHIYIFYYLFSENVPPPVDLARGGFHEVVHTGGNGWLWCGYTRI